MAKRTTTSSSSLHDSLVSQTASPSLNLSILLALAVEQMDDMVFVAAADWRTPSPTIIFVNEAFSRVTGYAREEVVNKASAAILAGPKTDLTRVAELREQLGRGQPFKGEFINYAKDGHELNLEWRSTPVHDPQTNTTYVINVLRDLSERNEAAAALEQERSLLRTLIDIIPDYIFIKDAEGHFLVSNIAHAQAAGQSRPEALTGKTAFDFFPPDLAASYQADDLAVVQSGQPVLNAQRKTVDQNGHEKQVLTTKVPLRDQQQHIIGLVGISRDVTELLQAEQALRRYQDQLEHLVAERTLELTEANETLWQEIDARSRTARALYSSEERLRRITDNMLDMIWQTDAEGTVEYASPSCTSILGFDPEALPGQSVYARVHPDHLAQVTDAVHHSGQVECLYQHADGHYLWLEILSSLVLDATDNIASIIFASRDITERKRVEREMQEVNQLKTEFLSTAAHELRTPLTSILGFSELLTTRTIDAERTKRYIKIISDQSNQLRKIVDALLDISRIESKQGLALELKAVNIGNLITHVLPYFAEYLPKYQFQTMGLSDCPPAIGDFDRLCQVMQNLVSNAIKYSPNSSLITIRAETKDEMIQISVQDWGIGMTEEQQKHLFERFYRADASNTTISGTGLGLAISKLIIELHNGHIWAESVYQQGTTISFTLPITNDDTIGLTANTMG